MVGAVIVMRRKAPHIERPYRTFGYPIVPLDLHRPGRALRHRSCLSGAFDFRHRIFARVHRNPGLLRLARIDS